MTGLQPVAWYKFDEASGATVASDSSGNGNDGTYMPGDSTVLDGDGGTSLLGNPGAVAGSTAVHFGTAGTPPGTPSPAESGGVYRGPYMTAAVGTSNALSLMKGSDSFPHASTPSNTLRA